jgi:hypothetical protein
MRRLYISENEGPATRDFCSVMLIWVEIDSVCWIGIFAQKHGMQEVKSGVIGSHAMVACVNPIVNGISFGILSNAWRPCSNTF